MIEAARGAGVKLIAYTSILHADTTPLMLAEEHRETEAALRQSGVPFVLLRNGWYTEVYTWRLPSFTLADLAAVAREASGKPLVHKDMSPEAFRSAAIQAGLPETVATLLSDTDAGMARGALFEASGALRRLIGRPTTPFPQTITDFVRAS